MMDGTCTARRTGWRPAVLAVTALVVLVGGCSEPGWPTFRGDPAQTGSAVTL